MTKDPVLICGATGTAGRATALALRDAAHEVIALGRTPARLPGIRDIAADFADTDDLARALRQLRPGTVVSCLASRSGLPWDAWAIDHDANLALLEAARAAGVAHFVLLSAICVQKPRLAFQHAKLAFEAALQASGLDWTIVRPTAFFKSLCGQVGRLRQGKPFLIFGDGKLTACKPISDADLGRFIATCLTDPGKRRATLPIGGPGPALTPRAMGAALLDALDLPPRFRSVPPWLLGTVAGGLSLAGRASPRLAAKAELARIGQYYATESMLLWDPAAERYDADATPEFGSETLPDFYRALARGEAEVRLGDHAVF